MRRQEDMARLITLEQGKPLAEARAEAAYAASYIEWYAEEAKRIYGDAGHSELPGTRMNVIKQPVGVCAAITPWNFPLAMIARKAAPALAAGCTLVAKPAEATPLSSLALAALSEEAGFPAGVFNVLTCATGAVVGVTLATHPLIRKISFTGSTAIGKLLLRQAADTVKKASMELGGNAPFIVFEDADLDAAAEGALAAKFRNAGQTCVCANRLFVHEAVYETFLDLFVEKVKMLKLGNGLDEAVTCGPLVNEAALAKVQAHIGDALSNGAAIAVGGEKSSLGGAYFQPTVLTGVSSTMRIAKEETFGPVAPLLRFHDEAEAIRLANDTSFGLAAYIYTKDHNRIVRVTEALEYGMVGVNTGAISSAAAPFGGVKESGIGREGSRYGLDEYLELKYLCYGGHA